MLWTAPCSSRERRGEERQLVINTLLYLVRAYTTEGHTTGGHTAGTRLGNCRQGTVALQSYFLFGSKIWFCQKKEVYLLVVLHQGNSYKPGELDFALVSILTLSVSQYLYAMFYFMWTMNTLKICVEVLIELLYSAQWTHRCVRRAILYYMYSKQKGSQSESFDLWPLWVK